MLTLPDRYVGEENRTRYRVDWQDFFTAQGISMIHPRNMDHLRANPNAAQNPLFVPDPSGYWAPDFAIALNKKTYGIELSTIGRHEEHFDDARYFPLRGQTSDCAFGQSAPKQPAMLDLGHHLWIRVETVQL